MLCSSAFREVSPCVLSVGYTGCTTNPDAYNTFWIGIGFPYVGWAARRDGERRWLHSWYLEESHKSIIFDMTIHITGHTGKLFCFCLLKLLSSLLLIIAVYLTVITANPCETKPLFLCDIFMAILTESNNNKVSQKNSSYQSQINNVEMETTFYFGYVVSLIEPTISWLSILMKLG